MQYFNCNDINQITKHSGIYIIHNKQNNKIYIGSAFDIRHRLYNHIYLLVKNKHNNKYLQNSWNKYGENNFEVAVLEVCSKENILEIEQIWLNHYQSYNKNIGYNICKIAGNTSGRIFSDETKEKMRQKSLGRKVSEESRKKMSISRTGSNNGMYGKKHTEESKQKISKNRKNTSGENNHFYGKHHSEETKNLLRKKLF